MSVYLDCNATTPIAPQVEEIVVEYMRQEFGNAGSRSHHFGQRAKKAVQMARDQVVAVVGAKRDEVIFTSGATESNNLAILGLANYAESSGRKHVVSTQIEHKAVLEPLQHLRDQRGFEVTLLPPRPDGWVDPGDVSRVLRDDTVLVSVMHANNETGILQPLPEVAQALDGHPAYFHVDAAQTFAKELETLRNPRIDLISVSGHKVYAPKGIGALIVGRRGFERVPLKPLFLGGGQERGLRPGTVPVPLIAGLGLAAELGAKETRERLEACRAFRREAYRVLVDELGAEVNGDPERSLSHVLNVSFPGLDSEMLMVALKNVISISNGSACTSQSYTPSHVLKAMNLSEDRVEGALRFSWCHMTPQEDWQSVAKVIQSLR